MNEEMVEQFIDYSKKCYMRDFVSSTSGNISIRDKDGILIKASGTCFGELDKSDVVFVNKNGNYKGDKKPSKEYGFHKGVYEIRDDINAIIHVHPPYSIALASKYDELPLTTVSAQKNFSRIPIVDLADPGSDELKAMVVDAYADLDIIAIVLRDHGVVVGAKDLKTAYYKVDLLEQNSKIKVIKETINN